MLLPMMDKKKAISIILGEGPEEKPVSKGLEADFSEGLKAAAADMIKAIEAKDSKLLASAMKSFIMMQDQEEDYSEGEMEG